MSVAEFGLDEGQVKDDVKLEIDWKKWAVDIRLAQMDLALHRFHDTLQRHGFKGKAARRSPWTK